MSGPSSCSHCGNSFSAVYSQQDLDSATAELRREREDMNERRFALLKQREELTAELSDLRRQLEEARKGSEKLIAASRQIVELWDRDDGAMMSHYNSGKSAIAALREAIDKLV
jgi:DNA repair exonuclease SbcCD ATPase subunit